MAERKGFDTPAEFSGSSFGIEQTTILDSSSDVDSFLSDVDPKDVTPISDEEPTPETPKSDKKESSTKSSPKQNKSEKEQEPEVSADSFLDEDEEDNSKEKETKKEEKSPTEPDPNDSLTEDENVFQLYSDSLFEMGIFTKDEGEEDVVITNPQEFRERWELEGRKKAFASLDNFIGKFGEKHKNFVVSVLNGVDPEEYFASYSNIENLSSIDITKEDNQKMVFREYWKRQNLSSEKIEKRLQRAVELSELEEDAKDFHAVLLEQEEDKLAELEASKQRELAQKEQQKRIYEQSIRSIITNKLKEKEFDGIPINEKVANDVLDFLITEKYQLRSGELITELDKFFLDLKSPENFEKRVKLALLAQSGFNLDNVKKSAVSKETNILFGNLKKQNNKAKGITIPTQTSAKETPKFKFNYSE